jgi:hypothetical protein
MPQSWDMGQKEGVLWIFYTQKKSDGLGRVRTRELGNQKPAR